MRKSLFSVSAVFQLLLISSAALGEVVQLQAVKDNSLPLNAEIESVQLAITINKAPSLGATPAMATLHRLIRDWGESTSSVVDHLGLTLLTASLTNPVAIANAGDGSRRLFVVEQEGIIRIYDLATNTLLATPFLDITSEVDSGGNERFTFITPVTRDLDWTVRLWPATQFQQATSMLPMWLPHSRYWNLNRMRVITMVVIFILAPMVISTSPAVMVVAVMTNSDMPRIWIA